MKPIKLIFITFAFFLLPMFLRAEWIESIQFDPVFDRIAAKVHVANVGDIIYLIPERHSKMSSWKEMDPVHFESEYADAMERPVGTVWLVHEPSQERVAVELSFEVSSRLPKIASITKQTKNQYLITLTDGRMFGFVERPLKQRVFNKINKAVENIAKGGFVPVNKTADNIAEWRVGHKILASNNTLINLSLPSNYFQADQDFRTIHVIGVTQK